MVSPSSTGPDGESSFFLNLNPAAAVAAVRVRMAKATLVEVNISRNVQKPD